MRTLSHTAALHVGEGLPHFLTVLTVWEGSVVGALRKPLKTVPSLKSRFETELSRAVNEIVSELTLRFEGVGRRKKGVRHWPPTNRSQCRTLERFRKVGRQLLEPDAVRLIFMPPFVVVTRTVGPPEPRFTASSLVIRPCTVTGKSTLRCPLTVPVSKFAE